MRKFLAFILLGVLTLVGAGGAVLGAVQSQSGTAVGQAVTNTLQAPSYTEDVTEKTAQGNQVIHIVYQAPDRLSGTIITPTQKQFEFFIGGYAYIAITSATSPTAPKVFYRQQSQPVSAVDPAQLYLRDCTRKPSTLSGSVTTVTVTQNGQTTKLECTVSGNYLSNFHGTAPGITLEIAMSKVGSSPPVALPQGYSLTTTPPSQG